MEKLKLNKLVLFSALLGICTSCSNILTADKVKGKYVSKGKNNTSSTIILQNDFTFVELNETGKNVSKGYYRISKNSIVFTLESDPNMAENSNSNKEKWLYKNNKLYDPNPEQMNHFKKDYYKKVKSN